MGMSETRIREDRKEAATRAITPDELRAIKRIREEIKTEEGIAMTVSELLDLKPQAEQQKMGLKEWAVRTKGADMAGVDVEEMRKKEIEDAVRQSAADLAMWDD